MADAETACPKCEQPMQEGFVLDTDAELLGIGRGVVGQWVEGPIEYGVFGGLKYRNKRSLPITALRCRSCGYLEIYVRNEAVGGRPQ
jgi:predicted nucleic-acid-binding Zn-ribbon protein